MSAHPPPGNYIYTLLGSRSALATLSLMPTWICPLKTPSNPYFYNQAGNGLWPLILAILCHFNVLARGQYQFDKVTTVSSYGLPKGWPRQCSLMPCPYPKARVLQLSQRLICVLQYFVFNCPVSACQAIPLLSPFCAGIKGHAVRGGNICLTEPINIADFCAAGSLRKKNYTMPNPYTTYPIYNFFAMEPNGPRISIVAGAYFLVCP